ncbi:formyltetrahydrofolate deformylase [Spirochaeta cellobiosiphila]|uniref:formyltetrahydrofolate deformylase n=1 Tax=Spirochaeta cellobiosiphila TaxID=504483 RepID=UPI0004283B48|nr:formyltetrahydrofolate deformylase [Spirochaeta cellobiosiphila]
MNTYVLKISCPDSKGIIAEVSQALSLSGANIIDLNQYSAGDIDMFFLKAIFSVVDDFDEAAFTDSFSPIANKFSMKWDLFNQSKKLKVAILVSKTNHCLWELLLKHQDGELNCEFPVIISNHLINEPIAKQFGIPFYHLDMSEGKEKAEKRKQKILEEYKIDILVMARYMQILSSDFTKAWNNRIINIHHGFLPAFMGAKPYHQAWYKGVKIIGATAHFATQDLDQGPIIAQDVLHITDKCSITEFVQQGKDIERKTLYTGLKLYLEHSVFVYENRTFIIN